MVVNVIEQKNGGCVWDVGFAVGHFVKMMS